ncbi:MAG: NapC/NirT family cytochrome c [Actinomycetota bacterium]
MPVEVRSFYRHPMAAVGGAIIAAGSLAFVILALIDATSPSENVYRSLVTYFAVPLVITIGLILFLVAIRIQVVKARRRGERVRFNLRVEPSSPKYMRSLWLFLGLVVVLVVTILWGGFKGYEATDSVAFCGSACHAVMEPQATTYEESPHAQVLCAECHIGPGASFWVRSKFDGIRQVYKTAADSYDRPIATPVQSLRPAQETCEQCHWPNQFYGRKLVNRHYYQSDEASSPWTISMLVNIGGVAGTQDAGSDGIHWHMLGGKTIEYIPVDEQRQEIPWVRVTRDDGSVSTFFDPYVAYPDPSSSQAEVRVFDCIDCHNRPSHQFLPPAVALNREIAAGTIPRSLPYVRRVGLQLLNSSYESHEQAEEVIRSTLATYYAETYSERIDEFGRSIEQAADTLVEIYRANFFPEMETDYRAHLDNANHFVSEGCFRCHGTDLVDDDGEGITSDCTACHTIVAQGPSDSLDDLDQDLGGLEFAHPVEIEREWEEINCTGCHTATEGY